MSPGISGAYLVTRRKLEAQPAPTFTSADRKWVYDFVAGRGTILTVLVVMLIAAVVILVGIVFVATGRGGELSRERTDYAPLDLGPASATDIALLHPPTALWGYDMQATDEAMAQIAESVRERDVRIVALEQLVTDLSREPAPPPLSSPYLGARHRRPAEIAHAEQMPPVAEIAAAAGIPPMAEIPAVAETAPAAEPAGQAEASWPAQADWPADAGRPEQSDRPEQAARPEEADQSDEATRSMAAGWPVSDRQAGPPERSHG